MHLRSLELTGFKSFGKKETLEFSSQIAAIVGPNGSGKSNVADAFRFALGEQSVKTMRGKRGEDLIWGGSAGLPRANRASVRVTFDNSKRFLDVDFDEVTVERTVYRDGINEYALNGSKVRLKDVSELLAGANIGASGHHIISQGEADRILSASPRERRHMLEDALGLRIYQYKKEESKKKLQKTEENKAQVEALRREVAPHLKFLERQMQKLERARELREKLTHEYHDYLRREERYLSLEQATLTHEREAPETALRELRTRLAQVRRELTDVQEKDTASEELLRLERALSDARAKAAAATRTLGRLEGQVAFEERRLEEEKRRAAEEEGRPLPYREVRAFWEELTRTLGAEDEQKDVDTLRRVLRSVRDAVEHFVERYGSRAEQYEPDMRDLMRLREEQQHTEAEAAAAQTELRELEERARAAQGEIERGKDDSHALEKEMYTLMARESELAAEVGRLDMRARTLMRESEEFKRELAEAVALIGRAVMGYKDAAPDTLNLDHEPTEEREAQERRKRELEKLKIRLEEMGGASADEITKEYGEVKERDQFLERELADLTASAQSLAELILELDRELSEKFKSGVDAITKQFSEFFALMFGGGSASLRIVSERKRVRLTDLLLGKSGDEAEEHESEEDTESGEVEEGIEVEVSLPKKRVQSLTLLSGGERALTSIALIFAMSQVNPPPFLILDETDAALDEANSRRYGDMIENLAQKSQLILITHNRETMSRAGILYGVTMGADGVSKLLSVKFDEAVAVAK